MSKTAETLKAGALWTAATVVALVLPLVLPLGIAVPLVLAVSGLLFWVGGRKSAPAEVPAPPPAAWAPQLQPPTEVPLPPASPVPPPPVAPGPPLHALQDLSWSLHEAIIVRIRSLLTPLSDSLFGVKNDLRGLVAKAGQLESSFRNDSQGLHQTVSRFETQSVTIRTFAAEMDKSVSQFETSSRDMGDRLEQITQAIHQINDVAERIKVLSINASIEAARAGHQGAGFKVISQEVRKLAEDTNQFSSQAERTISEAISEVQAMFQRFIGQYQGRAREIHQIRTTTQELEVFLKGLFRMIEGIFQDYDGFVGSLEANLDQVSPTLQQAEIGTQQIENTWKGIRDFLAEERSLGEGRSRPPTAEEALRLVKTFSRHLTTPLETEVVDAWARKAGVEWTQNKKNDDEDITLF